MPWTDEQIAQRIAEDIEDGWVVNLGIGIPTQVRRYANDRMLLHSENGILGLGPPPAPDEVDPDVIDAGKRLSTVVPGAAYMDSETSFAMIRGGHLDLAVLGAYQVAVNGDIANWKLPGRETAAVGGAADLVEGTPRVWVAMHHRTKDGRGKLVRACDYPLTGRAAISRVYTDLGVFEVTGSAFRVREPAPGVSRRDIVDATPAPLEDS